MKMYFRIQDINVLTILEFSVYQYLSTFFENTVSNFTPTKIVKSVNKTRFLKTYILVFVFSQHYTYR